ncbi:hypothetical protein GLAREA_04356 [Glarea lozoyensis ATCC 20868]|uniref:Uncharacterized protein n=1 Tax=Glarea lozoyensis (strain ATCC 20868 / MF5171) TaxID=1116229 RepID=S3CPD1_GLAL2|nr:uncharacterized protein GLAREA_04356 [Glarea lozoyensis ATCC 20868]EPE27565.1 hypothetical protein GLAREA_04356 [Glarea lozoyensis ATCC 20868]
MVSLSFSRLRLAREETSALPLPYSPPTEQWSKSTKLPSVHERQIKSSFSDQRLLHDDPPSTMQETTYVKWGVAWGVPAMMVGFTLAGVAIAIGHHGYYMSLHGTPVGSAARQNWALRFGTAFSFLSIALLRTACNVAYKQYIWTLFKRKAFSIAAIDRLFQLTNDLTAFRSLELIKRAYLAVALAVVAWCLPFTAITPPATLSVSYGFKNESVITSMPAINWKSRSIADVMTYYSFPTYSSLQMASRAAMQMNVLPIAPPAQNVSFHRQFYGPSVQCAPANESQLAAFHTYRDLLWDDPDNIVADRAFFETGKLKWPNATDPETKKVFIDMPNAYAPLMNVFSAFTPTAGGRGWSGSASTSVNITQPDTYNNWWSGTPRDINVTKWWNPNYSSFSNSMNGLFNGVPYTPQQIYAQTSDQSIVCSMGNASFNVDFTFVDGVQTQSDYVISDFQTFWAPQSAIHTATYLTTDGENIDPEHFREMHSYMGIFVAFTGLLNGNVTTSLSNIVTIPNISKLKPSDILHFDGNAIVASGTSESLKNGLSACPEYAHGKWDGLGAIGIGHEGPATWDKSFNQNVAKTGPDTVIPTEFFTAINNTLFKKPGWMCRNNTLMRAIEDLANNVTISMFSDSSFLTENATDIEVHHFKTINVYQYNSKNLIISYSIAIFVTLFGVLLGFYSLDFNGVAHSSNFSAIIGTTRNQELDKYVKGHSLGVFGGSRGQGIGKGDNSYQMALEGSARLRFGELVAGEGARTRKGSGSRSRSSSIFEVGTEDGTRHIGFGSVENVAMIKKGGKYV